MSNASPQGLAPLDTDALRGDSEFEFERLRSQNDLRLKSTFEAIFEKYGRDFTGIGDEIDLETGEIVVDNGHLSEMRDEQDVGEYVEQDMGRLLRALTEAPGREHESDGPNIHAGGREEEVYETFASGEDTSDEDPISRCHPGPQGARKRKASTLEQIGEELDQQISQYLVRPKPIDDSQVEPAWRAPGPAPPTPGTRPILRSVLGSKRAISSSPIQQGSLWAPPKRPGRPKAYPLEFFHDVLMHPKVAKKEGRLRPTSPIIISDSESSQEDLAMSSARRNSHSLSGNQIKPLSATKPMLSSRGNRLPHDADYCPAGGHSPKGLVDSYEPRYSPPERVDVGSDNHRPLRPFSKHTNSNVICLIPPMKEAEAQLYEVPESPRSVRENMNNISDLSFRRRLRDQRQDRRGYTLKEQPGGPTSCNATKSPAFRDKEYGLVKPPQAGGHPSLKQLAKDLFFTSSEVSTIDQRSRDSREIHDAVECDDGADDYHGGDYQMNDSESGSLWESESELQSQLGSESKSECESELELEVPRTTRRRNVPEQRRAKVTAKVTGPSSIKRLSGGRSGGNGLKEDRASSGEMPRKPPAVTCQSEPSGKAPSNPPSLPPEGEFVVSLKDDGGRPNFPYYMLCGTAILSSPERKLTGRQIQKWFLEHFAYFRRTSGWEAATHAALKPRYGFTVLDMYYPPEDNPSRPRKYRTKKARNHERCAHYYTVLPDFVHLYMKGGGGKFRPRAWRHVAKAELDGPPDTPKPDLRDLSPYPAGQASAIRRPKADILEFSDSECAAEGPNSNQVTQGRNLETAAEGPHPIQAIEQEKAEISESNAAEPIPGQPQSINAEQSPNAKAAVGRPQPTQVTQKQTEDILEFSDID